MVSFSYWLPRQERQKSELCCLQPIDQFLSKYDPFCYNGKVTQVTLAARRNQFQLTTTSGLGLSECMEFLPPH